MPLSFKAYSKKMGKKKTKNKNEKSRISNGSGKKNIITFQKLIKVIILIIQIFM